MVCATRRNLLACALQDLKAKRVRRLHVVITVANMGVVSLMTLALQQNANVIQVSLVVCASKLVIVMAVVFVECRQKVCLNVLNATKDSVVITARKNALINVVGMAHVAIMVGANVLKVSQAFLVC
jgi:hypothetical protein